MVDWYLAGVSHDTDKLDKFKSGLTALRSSAGEVGPVPVDSGAKGGVGGDGHPRFETSVRAQPPTCIHGRTESRRVDSHLLG